MIKQIVRLVLAVSIDGRLAFPGGGKTNIGGEGDRKVLENALAWSDATLIGTGTLKAHKSTCLIHNSNLIEQRLQEGRPAQPISIVVSKEFSLSRKLKFFEQPIKRWLLSPKSNTKLVSSEGFDTHLLMKDNWSQTLSDLNQTLKI